jgi:LAO/AO transport system kinase
VGPPSSPPPTPAVEDLVERVRAGDRRALARAITLVESSRPEHRRRAEALLEAVLPHSGGARRIGISGTPGVGKSTFIEELGLRLVDAGHRLAVLAVDPSSARTGGSILGDKTRMGELSRRAEAFIRPSPSGGSLGGVARRTREALLLCEVAGFDVVVVETVGVGQSETAVAQICDLFLLLVAPGGGDELQGIKRGIMELADLVAVNKADGALIDAARHTAADYRHALHLVRPKWPGRPTEVMTCSAHTGAGLEQVWESLDGLHRNLTDDGAIPELRRRQAVSALWADVEDRLLDRFRHDPDLAARATELEASVAAGTRAPSGAATELIELGAPASPPSR